MKKLILILAALSPLLACAQDKPVVLKGFDPVQLVAGKEVKGDPAIAKEFGKFKYLFANSEDEKTFEGATDKFAVQNDGKCLMMPNMDGAPDLYMVYQEKIYLAGSDFCLSAMKANPASYLGPQAPAAPTKTVAILIFPFVEIIDYSGPWEIFGGAGYNVVTVAATKDPIKTVYGQTVTPDYTFADCPKADILLLPGGGVPKLDKSTPTMQWIAKMVGETPNTLSVCNGAFWLAQDGLLDGLKATTTAGNLDRLANTYPNVHVLYDQRVTDNGKIMTSGGLSAGMDGALQLIDKLEGHDVAESVAVGIEYNWDGNKDFAPGTYARRYLRRAGNIKLPADAHANQLVSVGDKDHWQEKWEITATTSTAKDLIGAIESTLSAAKWTKISDDGSKSVWTFKGDDGSPWRATYTLVPDPSVKGKFEGSSLLAKQG
jgi:putative intracellular protease/amidase